MRKSCQIASIAFHNIVRLKFWLPCLAVMDWNLFSESLFEKWEKYSRGYNWYHIIWIWSNKWRKEMVDSNILTMIKQARFWKISLIFLYFYYLLFLAYFFRMLKMLLPKCSRQLTKELAWGPLLIWQKRLL